MPAGCTSSTSRSISARSHASSPPSSARSRRRRKHVVETDVQGSPVARADELRVLQVVRALLDNALTHTPEGTRVTLRAWADREHALIEVEDDGPGIAPEHAAHVFDRFYRGDGTVASGSGLGLAIARELVEMMGGEVVLDSRSGPHGRARRAGRRADVGRGGAGRLRFHVKTERRVATVSQMRPGALAAVSLVAAGLGAAARARDRLRSGLARRRQRRPHRRRPHRADRLRRVGAVGSAAARQPLRPGADLREPLRRGRHDLLLLPERAARAGLRLHRLRGWSHPDQLARRHHVRLRNLGSGGARRRSDLRRLPRRRPDPGHDRRLGSLQRHGAGQDRSEGSRRLARPARRLEPCRRRRAGRGDRQPLRTGELARGRRRLRHGALDRLAHLRLRRLRRDPDRRADQPRQLGRPAARRPRTRDRDQRADPLRLRERRGCRLRDPDQLGPTLDGAADLERARSPTPTSASPRRT